MMCGVRYNKDISTIQSFRGTLNVIFTLSTDLYPMLTETGPLKPLFTPEQISKVPLLICSKVAKSYKMYLR